MMEEEILSAFQALERESILDNPIPEEENLSNGPGEGAGNASNENVLDSSLILGLGASKDLLESRAIPDGMSPKRVLEWSPSTPRGSRGGVRKFSFSGASPTLRSCVKVMPKPKTKINWLERMAREKKENDISKEEEKRKENILMPKRKMKRIISQKLAANLSGTRKSKKVIPDNQSLITEEFGKAPECDKAIDGDGFGSESHDHGQES